MLRFLVEREGADLDISDQNGVTPLMSVVDWLGNLRLWDRNRPRRLAVTLEMSMMLLREAGPRSSNLPRPTEALLVAFFLLRLTGQGREMSSYRMYSSNQSSILLCTSSASALECLYRLWSPSRYETNVASFPS